MSSSAPFLLLLLLLFGATVSAETFKCAASGRSCNALIGFVPANATTLSSLKSLFHIKFLRDLLAANNLPSSTPSNYTVPAARAVRIPIRCSCFNGTGTSKPSPIYTVKKGDGLDDISRNIFGGFVTFQEVAAANSISNPDVIDIGQNLSIPLPCSCDEVAGKAVVHYAHKVKENSSVGEIASEFGVTEEVLLKLNGIPDPTKLQAERILDVPLSACSSSIRNDSLDRDLLIPNGSYVLTAKNCIQCSCISNSSQLQCVAVHDTNSSICPEATCLGTSLSLGQFLDETSKCTLCSYAGYGKDDRIFTVLSNVSTCSPAPGPASSPGGGSNGANMLVGRRRLGWMELLLIISAFFPLGFI